MYTEHAEYNILKFLSISGTLLSKPTYYSRNELIYEIKDREMTGNKKEDDVIDRLIAEHYFDVTFQGMLVLTNKGKRLIELYEEYEQQSDLLKHLEGHCNCEKDKIVCRIGKYLEEVFDETEIYQKWLQREKLPF